MPVTKLNANQLKTAGMSDIATDDELAIAITNHNNNTLAHPHNHDNNYVIKNTAIVAATGIKVTYDTKGLITSSANLAQTDIPNLDWGKIATGKPNTLAGYGITDGQVLNDDLTAIASLTQTLGFLKKTAVNTWALDNSTYYSETTGVPWASITGTPVILPNLSLAIQVPALSGVSQIPMDNTTPASNEGTLIATANYTASSVDSKMLIHGCLNIDCNTSNRNFIITVFRNGICVGTTTINFVSAGREQTFPFVISDLNMGTTFGGAATYTVRIGLSSSATWYVNRASTIVFNGTQIANSIFFSEYI